MGVGIQKTKYLMQSKNLLCNSEAVIFLGVKVTKLIVIVTSIISSSAFLALP